MVYDRSQKVVLDRQTSMDRAGYTDYRMRGSMENLFAEQAARASQNGAVQYNSRVRPTQ
jgi:hypothetical protein